MNRQVTHIIALAFLMMFAIHGNAQSFRVYQNGTYTSFSVANVDSIVFLDGTQSSRSPEAQRLLDYLKSINGKKMQLSATLQLM